MRNDVYCPPVNSIFPKSIYTPDGIYGFYGKEFAGGYEPINEYGFLSNMVVFDIPIIYQDISYYAVENFFVSMKTQSLDLRRKIAKMDPKKSKVYGRTLKLRPDWEDIKYSVLLYGLREKFSKNPYRARLLATGDRYIEETNWWNDKFFGVHKGYGYNILGFLLMHVRTELRLGYRLPFVYDHPPSGLFIYLE